MSIEEDAYIKLTLEDLGEAYVRKDLPELLRKVDAAIFDCDGVLIDARNSYNRAIAKTVSYIMENLTGISFPRDLISDEVIISFKRSGGFNSDWDLAYAILMYTLCNLPSGFWEAFGRSIDQISGIKDPAERLRRLREEMGINIKRGGTGGWPAKKIKELSEELVRFAGLLDEDGIESVDNHLTRDPRIDEEARSRYMEMKNFIGHPGGVGESLISTVFEEFFRGPTLFEETCGLEPRFNREEAGLIELEEAIIRPETLDRLESIFGGPRFGVASGSFLKPAEYILGDLLGRFKPEALIFYDEIERAEVEASKMRGITVSLKKPNPFSLFRSAEALEPYSYAVYIGDSMEDAVTVERAKERDPRFIFVGVYYHSPPRETTLRDFLESSCEVILPTVNGLPNLLEWVRRNNP